MRARLLAVTAAVLVATGLAWAGAWPETKHGDPDTGVERVGTEPRGSCAQCHVQHGSRDGTPTEGPFPFLLFAENDNALCATCHGGEGAHQVYPGLAPYEASSHYQSSGMVWPGPTPPSRPGSDAGKCVNCHDPHGKRDNRGILPALTTVREEGLCEECHDGSPGPDVARQLRQAFTHPVRTYAERHDAGEGNVPTRFGIGNRHAECVDCHNPHRSNRDAGSMPPEASARLWGVSRVEVTNGAAGTRPVYRYAGPGDIAFANEYEVCFKCHSSWTAQAVGQDDLGLLLNPANPSYHPVEARGRNRNVDPLAFANGWSWDRLVYCSDCHGSDDLAVRGPHGSSHRFILKARYDAVATPSTMDPADLCFQCHSYTTYADQGASAVEEGRSRFDHTGHVGRHGYSCFACHDTHGSTVQRALIGVGRGTVVSYVQDASGGTCTTTCHNVRNYTVNYPR
jgi:predicted CXXCH cytochrome family protein